MYSPELIQRITTMSPELMYNGMMLVDVVKVLDIIRDEGRKTDSVLQDHSVAEVSQRLHESNSRIMRDLLAKGHLLSCLHRPSPHAPDTADRGRPDADT